jgi:hypothetical protein
MAVQRRTWLEVLSQRLENKPETASVVSRMIPVNRETGQLYPPQEKIPEFLSEFAKYA